MSSAAPRLATYEDLLSLAEDARAQILNGQIVTSPASLPRHSKAQGSTRRFIGALAGARNRPTVSAARAAPPREG